MAQRIELLGAQTEGSLLGGTGPHEVGSQGHTRAGKSLIELHHIDQRLGVLALADGEVQRRPGRTPVARTVEAVKVRYRGRPDGTQLVFQVDSALVAEAHEHAVLDNGFQSELKAELIEVDVTTRGHSADQVEAAMPILLPAAEHPVAQPQAAPAWL